MRSTLTALAAVASCAAWADEPDPYYIGASQALTHESNVYRSSNGKSDTYSSTGLFGGFDQRISRQRVYARAEVRHSKYQHEDTLDNTGYAVSAGWDWATIEKLTGNFNVGANQGLASQGGNELRPTNARNLAKTDQVGASVRWGDDRLSVQGNYSHNRARYSALESLPSESSGDSGSVGVYYRVGPTLRLGTALRFTRTESPYAIPTTATPTGPGDYSPNTTDGRNLDLLADWQYSAQTGVNTRLSWTRQTNSAIEAQDFSGLTGSVTANYAPTAKLAFSASLARDAGNQLSTFSYDVAPSVGGIFAPISSISGFGEARRTTDTLALGAKYEATAKIGVKAALAYRRARIVNTLNVLGSVSSENARETFRTASLGADWAIARNWQLGCELSHESRDMSGSFGFRYDANIASCSARYTLR